MRLNALVLVMVLVAMCIVYVGTLQSFFHGPRALGRPEMRGAEVVPESPHSVTFLSQVADLDGSGAPDGMHAQKISCPMFSGPGYDKKRHPSHMIEVPEFEAPFRSQPRPHSRLEPLPLHDVRLLPHSAFARAFTTNLVFLKTVDTEALLLTWRLAAGQRWPPGAVRLMGWEHTGSELRGHFLGHWLSASAMSYAAISDADLAARIGAVLGVLEQCAASHKSGYLSAFPPSFLDRLEDISPVWVRARDTARRLHAPAALRSSPPRARPPL